MRKIFSLTALFISSHLLAQDSTKTMDEVTLSATKFSIKTTETGKVVTVITRKDIEHAGSRDLAQVISELGGVFINGSNSNAGKEKNIYTRGAKVDYTLITIDGIPVYDASGIGSNFDIRNISIDNIERIEILKGSQGTLYGSDAIAGVINIITKKGGAKPLAASLNSDYGSYNSWRLGAGIHGKQKIFDYNLNFTHFNTDGFSEAKKPVGATVAFDKDGYHENGVQANFGIQATSKFRLQPFLRYSKFKGSIDQDAFTDELDFTNENSNFQTGIRNTINVGNGQLNVLYQFINTKRNYLDDSTKSRNGFYTYNQQAYVAHEHFAEAFLVYPFQHVKLTAGADLRSSNTDYSAIQTNAFSPLVDRPMQSGDSVKQNQLGIYAALNYAMNGFNVEVGGRFNHHSEYGSNFAFNFNPSYFIQKKVKVFANISSGYKTPSLYQLFSVYGNKDLKPETSINLEGGLQFFTNNEKANIRVVYFDRQIKDVIAFFYNPVTFASNYINQDKQKDHGIEIDGSAKISEKVDIKAFYSYVTGKITTKQNAKDTTYFNLLRRPKSSFNFSIGSQFTKAFYASIQLNSVGERQDVYFDPVSFQSVPIRLKSYLLVNFYAEYAFAKNKLKVFADLRNILDKDYMDIYGYNTARFNAYGGIRLQL